MTLPALDRSTVHVWRVSVAVWAAGRPPLPAPADRVRIGRLVREADRVRAAAARDVFRRLASAYLGRPAHDLVVVHGGRGKPALDDAGDFRFNWSHWDDVVLLGFARGREVGVDVDGPRPGADLAAVVAREFTPRERARWERAGPGAGPAFFRTWTRKEAVLKATGLGLTAGPAAVETEPPPGSDDADWHAAAGCLVRSVPMDPPARAAVAVTGTSPAPRLAAYDWDPAGGVGEVGA